MTPVSAIVHYQGVSLHDHRCFCSPSITLFISLIFLKTLVSSLHNRDPVGGTGISCMLSLLLKARRLSVWPSHLHSWQTAGDPERPGPADCSSSREQWYTVSELSAERQGSFQAGEKAKLANVNVRGAGLGENVDSVGSSEEKIIKNTQKGSAWASSPHFRRNTDLRSEMQSLQHFAL